MPWCVFALFSGHCVIGHCVILRLLFDGGACAACDVGWPGSCYGAVSCIFLIAGCSAAVLFHCNTHMSLHHSYLYGDHCSGTAREGDGKQ